ncbi:energy transducer TonB [Glaciecola sp. MH2013]|uniref:energy transducer TonB n=1 Tax=Glaciecola sp. MH2013 TaxID=2785524 RepID=UPI0018A0CB50|nr:energy transducer TonB [Glaciecola sp. MH2013]MBF7073678.1 energy transducer TonB [Glaciecola sp. MH2013]
MNILSTAVTSASLLSLLTISPLQAAESEQAKLLFEVERAEILKRVPPRYPKEAAGRGQEGWVRFSYVITEEGNVIDPVVTDSSGDRNFERESIRAIKKWKFEPASQDGKPIQQCDMEVQFDFLLTSKRDDKSKGVRRQFNTLYKEATQAILDDDLEKATELANKIKNKKIWNMYENAWYWMLKARLAGLKQDPSEELKSLNRANFGGESKVYLGDKNYKYNLSRIFILQLQAQKFSKAHGTYLTLMEQEGANEEFANLKSYYERLDNMLNSDDNLVQRATIDERGVKEHELYRSTFAISNVDGDLDMLDIRCRNKRTKYTVATDTYWSIPKSWGQCSVLFEGDEDTSFDIIEVAKIKES